MISTATFLPQCLIYLPKILRMGRLFIFYFLTSHSFLNSNKLMLRENDIVVADEKVLATLMNNYFVNVTADLDLKRDS